MLFLPLAALVACGGESPSADDGVAGSDDALTGGPAALCDAAHPQKLVVTLRGADGRAVNGLVGIDLVDAHGAAVNRDGAADPGRATYPIVLRYNASYAPEGEPAGTPGALETWTGCVSGDVARAYLEAYPKDTAGRTDRGKYGETVYQYLALRGAGTYPVTLRFPVVTEYATAHGAPPGTGGTGDVFGQVTCNGAPAVPDHAHLRVWSAEPGWDCGIRAYAAAADAPGSPTDTSYKFSALAGGQCWAASQPVDAYVRGNCGGRYREVVKRVDVVTGKTIPVNVDLATGADRGPAR